MSRFSVAGTLLGLTLLLMAPSTSPACACGPEARFVVAHGTSPNGAPWRIKVDQMAATPGQGRSALFEFTSGDPDDSNGSGYFSSIGLPISRALVFHAVSGSGVYPELEGDVSGFAQGRAARLVAKMTDGSFVEIETHRAPKKLHRRFPWLRGLVFFDQFYPAAIEPVEITAYGRDGRVLSRQPA